VKDKTVKPETTPIKDDVDPSRIKTLEDSPDHITAKLNHRSLSADRMQTSGASSMLTNDHSNSSSNSMSVDNDSSLLQPAPVHRPKTVKIRDSKMRSTGNDQSVNVVALIFYRLSKVTIFACWFVSGVLTFELT
jgi:hypothetical protein